MISQKSLTVATTRGRGTYEITAEVQTIARTSGLKTGLVHVFVHHTSASLILCENADPTVRRDLETFMAQWIPDGAAWFEHNDEGPDDMPAHVRTVLTQNSLILPLTEGRYALGTWQGIYLWEHRCHPHRRQITVTVQGL